MTWQVNWRVISGGPRESREDDGSGVIYRGERVKFVISPAAVPNYQDTLRQAEQATAWQRSPQMTVIGEDRGRVVRVLVRHIPDNLLEIEYLFRYEGNKTLRFEGTPAVLDVSRMSARRTSSRLEAAFDVLRLELQIRVQAYQIGGVAQTMEGRSPRYRQAEEEREGVRERLRIGDREAARLERASQAEADEEQRVVREAARPEAHESAGVRRAYRRGQLHYELRNDVEVGRLSDVELEEYLSGLNAAIRITPGFRMYEGGNGSRPMGHLRTTDRWQVEYRPDRNQIAFFVEGNVSGSSRMESTGFVHTYPTAEGRREYRESMRAETLHVFPENAWVVLQTSHAETSKVLIHVRDLARTIEDDRFWQIVEGMATLGLTALSAAYGRPAAAVIELGLSVLLRVLLPTEAQHMVFGAAVITGLVTGVRAYARLGRTLLRRSGSAGDLARATDRVSGDRSLTRHGSAGSTIADEVEIGNGDARGTSHGSRGTPPPGSVSSARGGSGGGGSAVSRSIPGRRRSQYRVPRRTAGGYHDLDGRAIIEGGRVARRPSEVLGDLGTREYRVAQALARDGRETIKLPNQNEWELLIRQHGWSRDRVRRLMQRVREAQERDHLLTTRNPDLLVNGRAWDIVTQGPRVDLNVGVSSSLRTLIDKGVGRQTRRVIVDFTGYSSSPTEIRIAFRQALATLESQEPLRIRHLHQFIDEVAITVGERVYVIFSRGQGISF